MALAALAAVSLAALLPRVRPTLRLRISQPSWTWPWARSKPLEASAQPFSKKNGRFKVRFHAPGKATYHWFRVDKFKQLVTQQNMKMLQRHLAMTCARIKETLDIGAESQGSQDMPLEDTAESPRMPLEDAAEDEAESQAASLEQVEP